MKNWYLTLAIVGAIVPYVFYFQFIQAEGINFPLFISSIFANNPARGFTADVLLATLVFCVFIFQRTKQVKGPAPALYLVLSWTIGLSCTLPAYLYANTRQELSE